MALGRYREHKAKGICVECLEPSVAGITRCEFHRTQTNVKNIRRHKKRREQLVRFLGGKCVYCGAKKELQLDHIKPLRRRFGVLAPGTGGSNLVYHLLAGRVKMTEIQLACATCNYAKGTMSHKRFLRWNKRVYEHTSSSRL